MKLILSFLLFIFFSFASCKKKEIYGDRYFLDSDKGVSIMFFLNCKDSTSCDIKYITDKKLVKEFINDLNNAELSETPITNKIDEIHLILKDTCLIRLKITEDAFRIPKENKSYKLNPKYKMLWKITCR